MDSNDTFQVERQGDTLILIPLMDLGEVDYPRLESDGISALDPLGKADVKNVVIDFVKTEYYGSSALGFFVRIWKRTKTQGGQMAFCNVSAHEQEILKITGLNSLWPICASREEALLAVHRDADVK